MLSADDIKWIASHAADDTSKLRLRHANDDRMAHLIMQVENRHKYQKKLSQTLTCDAFEFPTSLSGEQATSDRLSEFHASLKQSREKVADMTAGLGIDSLHFALKCKRHHQRYQQIEL